MDQCSTQHHSFQSHHCSCKSEHLVGVQASAHMQTVMAGMCFQPAVDGCTYCKAAGRTELFLPSVKDTMEECLEGDVPAACLWWQHLISAYNGQFIVKAKRNAVRKWIVSQFGQFLSQLPKQKGSVFRCTVVCVLQWIEILQVGAGLNAGLRCRAVLGACTSAVRGLAESTAKPGRGCSLAGAGQLS